MLQARLREKGKPKKLRKKSWLKQAQKIEHNVSKAANKKIESNKKKRKHSWKISAEPRQGPQDDDDDGDDDDGRLTGEQTGDCSTVSLFGLIELQREKAETEQNKKRKNNRRMRIKSRRQASGLSRLKLTL